MANYYCEYCGKKASSVSSLVTSRCIRHPQGGGMHKLYEGSEKSQYTCKYCGKNASSLQSLVTSKCQRHPDGISKGSHSPAL